jgi:hypothetical protein
MYQYHYRAIASWLLAGLLGICQLSAAQAQEATLALADYAHNTEAVYFSVDGVPVTGAAAAGQLPALQVAAGGARRIDLVRSADNIVLTSATVTPEANRRYLVLASGNGQTLAYRLQVELSSGIRTRLFNASVLNGDGPETSVLMDSGGDPSSVVAAPGFLSENTTVDRNQLSLRLRRSSDGTTLMQLKQRDYGHDNVARDVIVVLYGTANALRADAIWTTASGTFVDTPLPTLALGQVQLKVLNGGAFSGAPGLLGIGIGGQTAEVDYGEFSSTIILPEQGVYGICASAALDVMACGSLEFEGGRSYVAITKSYSINRFYAQGSDIDQQPFLAYALSPAEVERARVRLHYAAVAPRNGEQLSVRSDDGSNPRQLFSPTVAQPDERSGNSVDVLHGAPALIDIKVSSADGGRNLANVAPFTPTNGSVVNAFLIGDGQAYPYRVVSADGLAAELTVDTSVSGFWTVDEAALEGFNLTPMPSQDRLLGTWFKHAADGSPRWYVLDSCASDPGASGCAAPAAYRSNTVRVRLYRTDSVGGARSLQDAGTMSLEFSNCAAAVATIDLLGEARQVLHLSNQTPTEYCRPADFVGANN